MLAWRILTVRVVLPSARRTDAEVKIHKPISTTYVMLCCSINDLLSGYLGVVRKFSKMLDDPALRGRP